MNTAVSTASSTETPRPGRTPGHQVNQSGIAVELVRSTTAFIGAFGFVSGAAVTIAVIVLAVVLAFGGCAVDEGSPAAPDCTATELVWPAADSCSPTEAICYDRASAVAYVGCVLQDGPLHITCVSTCDGHSKP